MPATLPVIDLGPWFAGDWQRRQRLCGQVRQVVFGEKYWQRWVRSYPDIARKFYPGAME